MKKSLLVSLILLTGVLLTACWKKSEEKLENMEPVAEITNKDCQTAIDKYLNSSDKQWEWEEIKQWDNIVVDYIWRLEDWTVFDTSIKTIAEACGTYTEARDYTEWLSFQAWAGQMVKWFDNAVIWMKKWQTKTVNFGPEEWYGEYDEKNVVTFPESEAWDLSQYTEWDTVYLWMWMPAKILKITDKDITLDLNHELAGKNLIFDITVKEISWEVNNTDNEIEQSDENEETTK